MLREVTTEEMERVKNLKDNRCSVESMLKEFINMNIPYAELEKHHYKTVESGVGSIRKGIERWHFNSVEVFGADGKIFLVNNNVTE